MLKKPLDYENLKNFTVKLRAQDQGSPPKFSDTTLRVVVTDADDQNPKFLRDSYNGELPPDSTIGEIKVSPEPIRAVDQDVGLRSPLEYSINPSPESRYFSINPASGIVRLTTPLSSLDLQYAVTLVIKATQTDNPDRYALSTLIVTRKGVKQIDAPLAFLQNKFATKAREDLGIGSRILALPTNKAGKTLTYKILDNEQAQYFSIGSHGELVLKKALDYERRTKHTFNVFATDGTFNATTEVLVDVLDINDWEPRFRQSHYEFIIPKDMLQTSDPVVLGKLEAADGDRSGDKITLHLKGPMASLFTVDTKGMLWLRGERPNVTTAHFLAIATDSGLPPRSTSVPVTVNLEAPQVAQSSWAPGVLATFGIVLGLFIMVILAMSTYIYKQ